MNQDTLEQVLIELGKQCIEDGLTGDVNFIELERYGLLITPSDPVMAATDICLANALELKWRRMWMLTDSWAVKTEGKLGDEPPPVKSPRVMFEEGDPRATEAMQVYVVDRDKAPALKTITYTRTGGGIRWDELTELHVAGGPLVKVLAEAAMFDPKEQFKEAPTIPELEIERVNLLVETIGSRLGVTCGVMAESESGSLSEFMQHSTWQDWRNN
jgi:hypothetical protein